SLRCRRDGFRSAAALLRLYRRFRMPASLLIPVNLHVLRRAADGDDVRPAVAIQIADGEVFDGDAAGIELGFAPVGCVVDADAGLGFSGDGVADARDEIFVAVAVSVRAPEGVAPGEVVVDDLPRWLGGGIE